MTDIAAPRNSADGPSRYSAVSIAFHWTIAVLLVGMVFFGWWMEDLREQAASGEVGFSTVQAAYNWHKTVGIAILGLSLARLGWRFANPVPPLPGHMKTWEKGLARFTHVGFYVIMIGAPLGGWVTASATNFPTRLFNIEGFTLPRLPVPQSDGFYETAGSLHGAAGWAILIMLALHAGGALKHHFIDRDDVLARMIPFLRRDAA